MKKQILLLAISLLTLLASESFASHLSGAELTWKCVQVGTKVKYKFKLKTYAKCGSVVVEGIQQLKVCNALGTLSPALNSGTIPNTSISILSGGSINAVLKSRKSTVLGCTNPTVNPLSCSGGDFGAIEERIYESAEIDFTGLSFQSGGNFPIIITSSGIGRSATSNLNTSPGDNNLVVTAKIYPYIKRGTIYSTSLSECYDSSPEFIEAPAFIQEVVNKDIYINNIAVDADMDEVRYELSDPLFSTDNASCATIEPSSEIYKNYPSFNTLNPFGLSSNLHSFNAMSGEYKIRPNFGTYNYVVKVKSYKNKQLVSEITRDYQTTFFLNTIGIINTPPVVIAPFVGLNGQASYTKEVIAGDLVKIPIIVRDSTQYGTISTQSLELTVNGKAMGLNNADTAQGCNLPPCAKLSKSKNNEPYSPTNPLPVLISNSSNYGYGYGYQLPAAYSSISNDTLWIYWKTACSNLKFNSHENKLMPNTFDFVVSVKDDTCRMPAKTSRIISVIVNPPLNYLKTEITCIKPNSSNHIEINWRTTGDTSKFIAYQLYRDNELIKVFNNHTIHSYIDSSSLANINSVYAIRLFSNCDGGNELYNEKVLKEPELLATQLANRNVKLLWTFVDTARMNGTAGYNVYRSLTNSPYNWQQINDFDGNNFDTTAIDNFKICGQSVYYLVTAIDKFNCVYMSNVDSIINLPLKVQIVKQKNCLGATTQLIFKYQQGGIKPFKNIQWTGDDGLFANNSDTVNHTYNSLGYKKFRLTIIDSFGCRYDFYDSVLIKKGPIVQVNIDNACPGAIINIKVTIQASDEGDSVHVYGDNGLFVKAGPYFDPFYSNPKWIFISNNGIGKFPVIIKVTKLNGCSITRVDTVYIGEPEVRILNDSSTCCNTLTDTLKFQSKYLTKPWNTVTWYDANTGKELLQNSSVLPVSLLTNYTNIKVKVIAEDAKGCRAEDTRNYNIGTGINLNKPSFLYTYPNPVSDVITFDTNFNLENENIKIYNTLGQLQYESALTNNELSVATLPKGVYQFVIDGSQRFRGTFVKE